MIRSVRFITCLQRASKKPTAHRQLTNKTMSSSSLLLCFISLPFFLNLFLQPNQNTYHLVLFYLCYNSHRSFSQECLPLSVQVLQSQVPTQIFWDHLPYSFRGKLSWSSLNFHRISSVALLQHSLIHLNNYFVHLYTIRAHLRWESEPILSLHSSKYFVHLSVKCMA